MIVYYCDQCQTELTDDKPVYALAHYQPADPDADIEDDDEDEYPEYQFCSPGCLGSWALTRELEGVNP